jgi:exodeoxyribonuclease III
MFKVASWNLNSVRSRLTHVTAWLKVREPDVLLLQELKGTEFPSEAFKSFGYESVAVTQKAYNGVAILSRHPLKTIAKALVGDDCDSHARFLEVNIRDIRICQYLCSQWQSGRERQVCVQASLDGSTDSAND